MKLHHVYSDYDRAGDAVTRHEFAKGTWMAAGLSSNPVHDNELTRTSAEIGDTRSLPFVKDIINRVAGGLHQQDIIMLTNDDTCVVPYIISKLNLHMADTEACFSHRREFDVLDHHLSDDEVTQGEIYPGIDLFAFTVRWWLNNRDDYPDLIIACQWWDGILLRLMEMTGGTEIKDVIYHKRHDAVWCQPEFIDTNPGQIYVRKLADEWLAQHPQ